MRIRGIGRLKTQWAKLRGKLMPGPMVLLHHRVAYLPHDPHLLAVTPEHFEEQLLVLRKHYRIVSLSELTEALKKRQNPGMVVALTFDDGYADNAEIALPILKKHGIPATFYLASGFVGTTREQLQDELERLLLLTSQFPDQLHLTIGRKSIMWDVHSQASGNTIAASLDEWNMESPIDPTPFHRAHRDIHNLLRSVTPAEREAVLKQLRSQCCDPGSARLTHRGMSWEQAKHMAASDLIELGAHTVNHPFLSSLSTEEQRMEILNSKKTIEAQTNNTVTSFAYPYGTRRSYTAGTVNLLKELRFSNACSNFRGRIGAGTDLFQIPRFLVRNWNGDEFLRRLKSGQL